MTNLEHVSKDIVIHDNAELLAHNLIYVSRNISLYKNATLKADKLTTID